VRKFPALVLLDKQPGVTSFDCIRALKRLWKRNDFGHGGTLDKFATGLLPVFFGEGLKLARFLLENYPALPTYWKTYRGEIQMGTATETGDPEGAVVETRSVPALERSHLESAMRAFVGAEYLQTPPSYSAKKIEGQRAGELARQGQKPELKPVSVQIREFECEGWDEERKTIRFRAVVSKGTYIRVLAQDLARRLDTAAHVTELRRTQVGHWNVARALTLEAIEKAPMEECTINLAAAAEFLPPFPLMGPEAEHLRVGKVDGLLARLANSGLPANAYRAVEGTSGGVAVPLALIELGVDRRAKFLRAFSMTT